MASCGQAISSKPVKIIFFPNVFYPILFNMTNNESLVGFRVIGRDFTKLWAFPLFPDPASCVLKNANKYFRFGQSVLLEIWYTCSTTK